jgi:ketosteroid isomerase-like protein
MRADPQVAAVQFNEEVRMRRPLTDRIALLLPGLVPLMNRWVLRLRPGSAMRRRALDHLLRRAYDALNRRDFDVILLSLDPDVEIENRGIELTGVAESYRGHDGFRANWTDWLTDWEKVSHRVAVVLDLGDRLVLRIEGRHLAPSTGLRLDSDSGAVLEFQDGLVKRYTVWFHWADAVAELSLE